MGIGCNVSSHPCETLKPCQNNGTCSNAPTDISGYSCICLPGFNGTQCQYDHRPCKPTTCWNNGTQLLSLSYNIYQFFFFRNSVMKHQIQHLNVYVNQDGQVTHCELMINLL